MTILKLANIEKFETLFQDELHQEQKYLPISKKLVVLLNDMNPTMSWIEDNIKFRQKLTLDVSLQIHRNYVNQIDANEQDLLAFNKEHKLKLDQFQKDKIQALQKINRERKEFNQKIDTEKDKLSIEYKEQLKKLETQLKREQAQFEKEKNHARKIYQDLSKEIEQEKKQTSLNLEKRFAEAQDQVDKNLEAFKIELEKKLAENETQNQEVKKENDQVYLNIKNNYHVLTTQFNQSINKLKKAHDKAKNSLENEHKQKIEPVHKRLESLNKEYKETIQKAKRQYQANLIALDDRFNQQKEKYEEKKARIVHQSNEQITLLNSKLSAFRESIGKEKLDQSRAYRDEIKKADSVKIKDKVNRELTIVLRTLDNDLNKQILRTQKDIVTKQKELQQNLYQHDINHLKEMNDWRLKRNLLSYEHKQEIAKIDLNFNHNISLSKKHLTLLEDTFKFHLHVLNVTLRKDLLPLETQLQGQSLVQERELNLLNNDQHLSTYLTKFNQAKINYEYDLKVEQENHKAYLAKLDFDSETQVVKITSQLELEKIKSKRDFTQSEQDIRSEIASALFERSKQHSEKAYHLALEDLAQEERLTQLQTKYKIEAIKLDQQQKHHQASYHALEVKSKHQANLSHEKALRLMKIYLNELNHHQKQSEYMFYGLRMFYEKHQAIKTIIKELYLLPSHPEVFKNMLNHLLAFEQTLKDGIKELILYFKTLDLDYYQKKIDDQTEYKYMIKHEDAMNIYEQELEKINVQEKSIKKEINTLEQQFFIEQQTLERHMQFITQLEKINEHIQQGIIKSNAKHKDIKENKSLISNHEKEIKHIKHKLSHIEKAIDKKHLKLMPFEKQANQISLRMHREEDILKKHQQKESHFYEVYQAKNQNIYDKLLLDFNQYTQSHMAYVKTLLDTVYVTDSQLLQEEKKLTKAQHYFESKLIMHQQYLLNHMHQFYLENDHKQDDIVSDFKRSQAHWLNELKRNNENVLSQIDKYAKKYVQDEVKETKALKDAYLVDKTHKETELNKRFATIQQDIKNLEIKLQEHLSYMTQEIKSLNDNQTQFANQSYQEYQKQQELLHATHQKQISKIEQTLDQEDKTYQSFVQSTESKNQALLNRSEQARIKQLDAHNQKLNHFNQDILKSEQAQEKREKTYQQEVALMGENRAYEIKNMNDHIKKYNLKTERAQHKVMRQEQRLLRKNFKFKLKELHLR